MIGVLLINIGTPDAPSSRAVGKYLNEFLMDPLVVQLPWLLRFILVRLLIVPRRKFQSAEAYQSIWTERGSPLLVDSLALEQKLQEQLGNNYLVKFGMRYGSFSVLSATQSLEAAAVEKLFVLPMFPQYSKAATQSAFDAADRAIQQVGFRGKVVRLHDFYAQEFFIAPYAALLKAEVKRKHPDVVLFSYHGLPEKGFVCKDECPVVHSSNASCYRAQCYATTRALIDASAIDCATQTSFQSRLGRVEWIKPYTDVVIKELIARGHKNLLVICPAFVTDCLETLEEIGMRLQEQWRTLGGESFGMVPCLNSEEDWVCSLADFISHMDSPSVKHL